ncbi:exosome complex exonuclease RRP6 [Nannizzia gypsea CBS 118893]|uniref:Exosome complex exonuclease RRP6 n=1 Tax=Arthroderma gypseum (strain ATCC MYA-4604 / CBS 118893) TaxID=535722 RepID=E5R0R1_ARTGP|nr:exosome component 3'-5' exonuclease [Nannizzia gypsea CBS 118893]EFQ97567.1 exosome complex exonuclease RRP6 [Nannizzia gypsea CBS 118893]
MSMDGAEGFTAFQEQAHAALVNATKTSQRIVSSDLTFHRSFDSKTSRSLTEQSNRLLGLTNSLLRIASSNNPDSPFNASSSSTDTTTKSIIKKKAKTVLRDEESIDENWKAVVDVIDELLEKADACLDEFTGVIKKFGPGPGAGPAQDGGRREGAGFPRMYSHGSSKIAKPQLGFDVKLDNADDGRAFRPLLKSKPHALVGLEESLGGSEQDPTKPYNHPYEKEIEASVYPESVYQKAEPTMYQPVEGTKATFVETLEDVQRMLAQLKQAKEIAVDLEHHDGHVYHGLVCLMQISTREQDWIVDTLKPWRDQLQILNEVFADPSIVKVLHGSSMDVIWLQRDLGLYLVGLFDTFHAASVLQLPKKSLKFLLHEYVGFDADKKYQTADWRIRPLLTGMLDYARSDTHFLLYIFDRLRNELLALDSDLSSAGVGGREAIECVLERSKESALQRYERPTYDAARGRGSGGWHDMLSTSPVALTREQFAVFRALHEWRDKVARTDDESTQTVLSKRSLFRIAQEMPEDKFAVLRMASPVSASLRSRTDEVAALIRQARQGGATGPEMHELIRRRSPVGHAAASKDQAADHTLASAAATSTTIAGSTGAVGVRTKESQFWGQAELLQEPEQDYGYSVSASTQALQLSLPVPSMPVRLVEGAVPRTIDDGADEEATSGDEYEGEVEAGEEQEEAKTASKSNEIFTVRQFGKPLRKTEREAEDGETAFDMDASEILLDEGSARKKEKKMKQQQRSSLGKRQREEGEGDAGKPFDYASAESLIHREKQQQQQHFRGQKAKGGPGRRFNAYEKLLDAPSGVKKTRKETAGRSHTFR